MDIKKGDKFICLPGFIPNGNGNGDGSEKAGGYGYYEGRIFVSKGDIDNVILSNVLWPEEGGNGIYYRAVKPYDNGENYEIY